MAERVYTIATAIKKLKAGKKYASFRIRMRGMYDIEAELEELGYTHDPGDGDNTNGWEVDFFYKFTHPTEPTLTISGAIWQNGNSYHISKSDEE